MKKTSNKGFSLVELIIVIAIMAILAAALAPALLKYINKSRLSTAVSDGTTIAGAMNAALASEAAFQAADSYSTTTTLNGVLGQKSSNSFAKELQANLAKDSIYGKAKKDLPGSALSTEYWIKVDAVNNLVEVYYGSTDANHMCSPNVGTALAD